MQIRLVYIYIKLNVILFTESYFFKLELEFKIGRFN